MSKSLRLEFEDQEENKATISITDPKDGLTKADAKEFGDYLVSNSIVRGKKAKLNKFDKAFIVTRTEVELV